MFRLCIKVDRIKIENLILILEVVLVDFDFDCWIFVFGGICDLFLYFWCVFNGIVLCFKKSFENMIKNVCSFKYCFFLKGICFFYCL